MFSEQLENVMRNGYEINGSNNEAIMNKQGFGLLFSLVKIKKKIGSSSDAAHNYKNEVSLLALVPPSICSKLSVVL